MAKNAQPKVSSGAVFFSCAVLLILVATILAIGNSFVRPEISFGSCTLTADVARTSKDKALGLSGRLSIDPDYAMIFPFSKEQPSFWMKDMLTSIDMVWVANDKVVQIDQNLPVDDGAASYQPTVPIDWVVEVAAGRTKQCGVEKGNTIEGLRY